MKVFICLIGLPDGVNQIKGGKIFSSLEAAKTYVHANQEELPKYGFWEIFEQEVEG